MGRPLPNAMPMTAIRRGSLKRGEYRAFTFRLPAHVPRIQLTVSLASKSGCICAYASNCSERPLPCRCQWTLLVHSEGEQRGTLELRTNEMHYLSGLYHVGIYCVHDAEFALGLYESIPGPTAGQAGSTPMPTRTHLNRPSSGRRQLTPRLTELSAPLPARPVSAFARPASENQEMQTALSAPPPPLATLEELIGARMAQGAAWKDKLDEWGYMAHSAKSNGSMSDRPMTAGKTNSSIVERTGHVPLAVERLRNEQEADARVGDVHHAIGLSGGWHQGLTNTLDLAQQRRARSLSSRDPRSAASSAAASNLLHQIATSWQSSGRYTPMTKKFMPMPPSLGRPQRPSSGSPRLGSRARQWER